MKVFQPRHSKNAEVPEVATLKTLESYPTPPYEGIEGSRTGVYENLQASGIWLEAIQKVQGLEPSQKYVVRVIWPCDDRQEVARLVDGDKLTQALDLLSKMYPAAEGVLVCLAGILEPVLAVGTPPPPPMRG